MKARQSGVLIRLWSINRWLRWTGFRLVVGIPDTPDGWTLIGIRYWGWSFVRGGE